MKNKERFKSYEKAQWFYDYEVCAKFGTTRLPWGFGRWLWLEYTGNVAADWGEMDKAGILTAKGKRDYDRYIVQQGEEMEYRAEREIARWETEVEDGE